MRALRWAAAIISLLLSGYGLLTPLLFLFGAANPEGRETPALVWLWGLIVLYAWIAWLKMGINWAEGRRVQKFWPITGTIAGCISVLIGFPLTILMVFPAVLMALIFVRFHLVGPKTEAMGQ